MSSNIWSPSQYNKFKEQRSRPFWDLISFIQELDKIESIIDLGCGTGELTGELAKMAGQALVVGIDSSEAMLQEAQKFSTNRLHFEKKDLNTFVPSAKYDLVFSNAALQWLPGHEHFLPKVLAWVGDRGQIAIQMPYNLDHPSHRIAHEVAQKFPPLNNKIPPLRFLLPIERYAQILYYNGFEDLRCRVEVYPHPMESGRDVIEWTKGTLLTSYQKEITPSDFEEFLSLYSRALINEIGEGPYLYTFKRLLFWGRRV